MKALVLAGGSATRLRPFSYSMPKQMIPVANKPVLERVLEDIRDAGITEVGIIVTESPTELSEVIGDGDRFGIHVTYLRQERPRGLAHCILLARDFLAADDFVMYLGDNVLSDGIVGLADEFREQRSAAHIVVRKTLDPRAFGVAEVDADGLVARLVEKPREPATDLAVIGVYFFTSAIHVAVGAINVRTRGELEITDAIQWLIEGGAEVRCTEYVGYWRDVGSVDDVLECNGHLLGEISTRVSGMVDLASRLTGQVIIEPGATVTRTTIVGPAIVGAHTVVQDSHIGPHSSIGAGCTVSNTQLKNVVVLDGAMITGIGGLQDSIVGRSAHVAAPGNPGEHHRLIVGDHTDVDLVA